MKKLFICILSGLFFISGCITTKYYKSAKKLKNNERGAIYIDKDINIIKINGDEKASSLQGFKNYRLYIEPGEYILTLNFTDFKTRSGIHEVPCKVEAGKKYMIGHRFFHHYMLFKCFEIGELKLDPDQD